MTQVQEVLSAILDAQLPPQFVIAEVEFNTWDGAKWRIRFTHDVVDNGDNWSVAYREAPQAWYGPPEATVSQPTLRDAVRAALRARVAEVQTELEAKTALLALLGAHG